MSDPIIRYIAYENGSYSLVVGATKDRYSSKERLAFAYADKGVIDTEKARSLVLYNDPNSVDSGDVRDYPDLVRIGKACRLID